MNFVLVHINILIMNLHNIRGLSGETHVYDFVSPYANLYHGNYCPNIMTDFDQGYSNADLTGPQRKIHLIVTSHNT